MGMRAWLVGVGCSIALQTVASAAFAQQTVTLVAYSGLFQERYTKSVIEPFEQANPGIKVSYFALASSGQMLGTLRAQKAAPQADVAILDVTVSKAGTDEGIFAAIDEKSVPNIADLRPEARFPGVAGVGVTFDNFDIVYNPDQVKTAPTSLKDLAAPALKGMVAFNGMPDIIGLSAIVVMDKVDGGPGVGGHFTKGFEAMGQIAPNIQTWTPQPEVYPVIISGQVAAGLGWNARSQYYANTSNGKLKAVLPSEGTVFQINTINLVAGGPASDAAKRFINYALDPETQKRFSDDMFYAPTNAKVQLGSATLERTALSHLDKVVPVDWMALAKIRDALMDQWRRSVLPLSR
jgi:putative spermidine/putrescine transport system substrate-binding protein